MRGSLVNGVFRAIQIAWTLCAWFLFASMLAAPFVALVIRCRARSKRLFVDKPNEVLRQLRQDTRMDHRFDA